VPRSLQLPDEGGGIVPGSTPLPATGCKQFKDTGSICHGLTHIPKRGQRVEKGGRSEYQAGANSGKQVRRHSTQNGRSSCSREIRVRRQYEKIGSPYTRNGKRHQPVTT
jgi:hypothetical protein